MPTGLVVLSGVLGTVLLLMFIMISAIGARGRRPERAPREDGAITQPSIRRLPFVGVIPDDKRGQPYLLGRPRPVIGRGFYVRLPVLYVIDEVTVQEQVIEVPSAQILFAGGASIGLNLSLTIDVPNVSSTKRAVRDFLPVVAERARQAVQDAYNGADITELTQVTDGENPGRVRLMEQLERKLADLHVEIRAAAIVDTIIPDELQNALVREAAQAADNRADLARAENETQVAEKNREAARTYKPNADEAEISETARWLRDKQAQEDMQAGLAVRA